MTRRKLFAGLLLLAALPLLAAVSPAMPKARRGLDVTDLRAWRTANKKLVGKKLSGVLRAFKARTIAVTQNDTSVKNEVLVKRIRAVWKLETALEGRPQWARYEGEEYFDCVVYCENGKAIRLSLGDTKGGKAYGRLITQAGLNYFPVPWKR